ncbi:FAD-binding protein [Sphingopyxis flava]|uniref:3-oxosteroid 1-dehydrogenase n=1 Tax=Sphingopyxis flava TaxID=1507287 RepID=A0A1T5FNQ4_9SPHN|nr:FAD-binding protein [Sphingopyxis flava]SKB97732.1 3-oxosteroid 1-dehydrogenase [Sphingopyxis flava]
MSLPTPESLVLENEYDFVIVGSGGGSMVAAIYAKLAGLNPVILEKRDKIGGSTGFSGGVWWVPNNHVIKRFGVDDSRELAERYLNATVDFAGKGTSPERRDAFLDEAPEMIRFLEEQGMQFHYPDGWSDYYDDRDGGQPRGRSLTAVPYDMRNLGPWEDKLSRYMPFNGIPFNSLPLIRMLMFKKTWYAKAIMVKLALAIAKNKILGRHIVSFGGAIQGRMLEMTLKRDIPVFGGFATDRLVEENGKVVAVEGEFQAQRRTVRGKYGVLMNVGGFARNDAMRQKYQRHPISNSWTNANPGDTGEMIEEMIRLGADTENLDMAVWVPTSLNPDGSLPAGAIDKDGNEYPFMHVGEIAIPHYMWVNRHGKRFVNEANSYVELGEAMYQNDAVPAFAVFDDRAMRDYAYGTLMPGTKPIKKWLESGFLVKADTIEELAEKAGIDPAGLAAQVERYNRYSETGIDEEFHKGERQYDRFRGDPTNKPNPCVGAISKAPFYATRIFPGDVGTFGGVVTDEKARVLRADGSIIDGLYATGNCTSSVMGRSYPGPGASISPAFAFGYIAAKDAVARAHNRA